jgi:hypothetical protein
VTGLPLYLAAAAFIRHSLRALYTSLSVTLTRVRVEGASASSSPGKPLPLASQREKRLVVYLKITGTSRVSGASAEWDVYVSLFCRDFLILTIAAQTLHVHVFA